MASAAHQNSVGDINSVGGSCSASEQAGSAQHAPSVMAGMREITCEILGQRELAAAVWELTLRGDFRAVERPGQFVNIAIPGFFLRRPISVANLRRGVYGSAPAGSGSNGSASASPADELTLVYKVVGEGTAVLAQLTAGTQLNLLVGLGNGFTLPTADGLFACAADHSLRALEITAPLLLVGGGVGVPPLYWLARELRAAGCSVSVALGFNSASDVFYESEFRELGCTVQVATADGSYGTQGFVPTVMPSPSEYAYFYACGPIPMLRAVVHASGATAGELSFEERMGCGFGACMGCSHRVLLADGREGYKRICAEGPVLRKEEIVWES
ncbi:MAG: dihydroorotate dehydrogenase electron transfer subunit [Arcanobacterium sp.]|nr:dihydroorotate dehydrogenase electron transfer subunit [Arcanobacterium sp.]